MVHQDSILLPLPLNIVVSVKLSPKSLLHLAQWIISRNPDSGAIFTKTAISSSVSCFFLWQSLFYPKLLLKFTHSTHTRRLDALLSVTGYDKEHGNENIERLAIMDLKLHNEV